MVVSTHTRSTCIARKSQGFTLVETAVAAGVTGLLAAGLYTGMAHTTFDVRLARENERATQIMVEKMELIRLYNWDQINSNGFIPPTFTAPYYDDGTTNNTSGLTYTGTVTIGSFPGTHAAYSNDLRLITIDLNWSSGRLARSRSLTTYVSRYGLQNYLLE